MLIEFDQSTIANMTAALEWACKKLPADKDNREVRKKIADAMVESARGGRRTYLDFQHAGTKVLEEIVQPPKLSRRLGKWLFRKTRRRERDGMPN